MGQIADVVIDMRGEGCLRFMDVKGTDDNIRALVGECKYPAKHDVLRRFTRPDGEGPMYSLLDIWAGERVEVRGEVCGVHARSLRRMMIRGGRIQPDGWWCISMQGKTHYST